MALEAAHLLIFQSLDQWLEVEDSKPSEHSYQLGQVKHMSSVLTKRVHKESLKWNQRDDLPELLADYYLEAVQEFREVGGVLGLCYFCSIEILEELDSDVYGEENSVQR